MNLAIEAALDLIARGMTPIAVESRGKRPLESAWQKSRPDRAQILAWRDCNIGVVLGDASGGLVDIDLDVSEAAELASFYLPATWTFGRASKPSSHWLYIAPSAATRQFKADTMLLELRSTGAQTVMPPSTHSSGEAITWGVDACDATDGPRHIDAAELLRRCADLACATLARRAGCSVEESIAWEREQHAPAPQPRRASRPSTTNVAARARRYLDRMPLAVAGSGGHAALWAATLAMVRGFALDESDARDLLTDYSSRCSPPWSEREIDHKIAQAMERAQLPMGYLLEGGAR